MVNIIIICTVGTHTPNNLGQQVLVKIELESWNRTQRSCGHRVNLSEGDRYATSKNSGHCALSNLWQVMSHGRGLLTLWVIDQEFSEAWQLDCKCTSLIELRGGVMYLSPVLSFLCQGSSVANFSLPD